MTAPVRSQAARERTRSAWLFLAPMLTVLALVAAWPLARTVYFSLTNATLVDMRRYSFVGLSNYLAYDQGRWYGVLSDPQWVAALKNTLVFAAVSVTLETVLGVAMAVLLNTAFPGRGLMRAALLVPWAIPTVVSAKMWSWMLNDQFGVVNDALMKLGLIAAPVAWLAEPSLSMAAVVMVDVWKTTPFVALLALAALQMTPKDCYEAARVDGVHPVRVFFQVTLPLIRPALAVAVIFRLLDAMRMFDLVYIMTGTTDATITLSVFARRELVDFQDVGYGSAASTLLFFVIALMTVIYMAAMRPDVDGRRR
ncbi:MAG: carbohydrate ABC transporter permease [Phenylobacterium sp.]|uniref:carbohydrate ABC transporter permease n=1 Tax=Phenylobacterium sp. TaxID=1871053 RepID=UPI00391A9F92